MLKIFVKDIFCHVFVIITNVISSLKNAILLQNTLFCLCNFIKVCRGNLNKRIKKVECLNFHLSGKTRIPYMRSKIIPVTEPEDVTFNIQLYTSGLSILTKILGKRLPSQLVMDPCTTPSCWFLMPSEKRAGPPESPLQVPSSVPELLAQKTDPLLNLVGRESMISK